MHPQQRWNEKVFALFFAPAGVQRKGGSGRQSVRMQEVALRPLRKGVHGGNV